MVPRPRHHPHPRVGGHRGRARQLVLVRGQLRVLRGQQGRAARGRRRAPAPRHLPQAHAGLSVARLAIPVAVRWADLDAYGHVNNVAVLRLLEEARVAAFWHPGDGEPPYPTAVLNAGPGAETTTVVAKHEVEYLAPFGHLRDGVVVE